MTKLSWRVAVVVCPRAKTAVYRLRKNTDKKHWLPQFVKESVELPGAPLDAAAFAVAINEEIERLAEAGYEPTEFLPWNPAVGGDDRKRAASPADQFVSRKRLEPEQGLIIIAKRA